MNSPKQPMPLHSSALMEIGLILLVVTLIINVFARLLIWKVTKGQKRGSSNMQNPFPAALQKLYGNGSHGAGDPGRS